MYYGLRCTRSTAGTGLPLHVLYVEGELWLSTVRLVGEELHFQLPM